MQVNIQPIEKLIPQAETLQVHSIFYTIQGEGPFTGHPAIFIRLAGCNLQCPGCDTDYTSRRQEMTVSQIFLAAVDAPPLGWAGPNPIVVITGGEPFRQPIAGLVRYFTSKGYRVQIETNGTLFRDGLPWDSITVVCSPKTGKINERLLPHIDAFKYVMHADSVCPNDGLPTYALRHPASPRVARPPVGNTKPVYLQPMDVTAMGGIAPNMMNQRNLHACIESCMKFGYILQLQVHKIINME